MRVHFNFANPNSGWKSLGNSVLKWADNVKAGHFAIELATFEDNYVYESVFPKSTKTHLFDWFKHYEVQKCYSFDVPTHLQYEVKEWLDSQVGVRYSLPQLVLIALCMFKPINDKLNWTILNHNKALICTELGSRFIEKFMVLTLEESHDKIGLHDMYDYCEQLYFKGEQRVWRQG